MNSATIVFLFLLGFGIISLILVLTDKNLKTPKSKKT